MEAPHVGLGLHASREHSAFSTAPALSTAPASPTDIGKSHKASMPPPDDISNPTTLRVMAPQHSTVAQLSFGPATQQTVTTVTTTTTVTMPPIMMKPPQDLHERDPKQYPLAFSPTPKSIRRFCFDVNGKPTTFHEAEDAEETLRKHHELQEKIRKQHGSTRKEEHYSEYETPDQGFKASGMSNKVHGVRVSNPLKRTATPPSIAEAAELASLQRKSKKPRSQLYRTQSGWSEYPSIYQRVTSGAVSMPSNPSPVTPNTDESTSQMPAPAMPSRKTELTRGNEHCKAPKSRLQQVQAEGPETGMALNDEQENDTSLVPPFYGANARGRRVSEDNPMACQPCGAAATPPIVDTDLEPATQSADRPRLQFPSILTSSQQDASLPSPSLSPITAAANAASRNQNAFDASFAEHNDENASTVSGLDLDEEIKVQSISSNKLQHNANKASPSSFKFTPGLQRGEPATSNSMPTIMDIPTMVDAFDSMPEAMQTYLIYQFLRRCAKPTLQMVANVVNPALKCDPFNVLPPELGLNITRFLDAQSMCRAAQVSKRWRKLINSDERAWKDLLDRDEFVLPKDEIARAVKEGWGWQHPGVDGSEQDLSKFVQRQTPETGAATQAHNTIVSDDEETASSTVTPKSKKKSALKHGSAKKFRRRTAVSKSANASHWRRLLGSAQGPIAFANAATHAVPPTAHPAFGLPTLRNMHLFKSLYQRRYLIRKAWIMETSQPQHLAFRAHHRHVVTCLLFDGDKILTGSDDTKINVYDTKTGALRNRLEGHEGGVWALQYVNDTLVSGSTDRSVRVWDIKTGRCLQVFQGHTSTVRCLEILQPVPVGTEPDGTPILMPKEPLIITGSRDSTLRVWKLPQPGDKSIYQAGQPANDRENPYFLRTLSGHHNSVRAIAAHSDTLVSGSYDCTVRVWKISTGDLVHRLQGHSQKVYSVVLDHKRTRCISGSMDNLVKVWDLNSGACLFNLEGHTSLVGLLDLSHDRLVSAAADSTLRIWDPESGACKATLSAHTGAITCFQHDGQKVISGSDRTLKMWNVRNGECVRDLLTDLSGVWQVRFDERRCIAAVQRNNLTYIEVLDFGASRDGVPPDRLGRRVVVDCRGREIEDVDINVPIEPDVTAAGVAP